MEMDHVYTTEERDTPSFNRVRDFYLERITHPLVVHAHLLGTACDGNCPSFNLPNEDAEPDDADSLSGYDEPNYEPYDDEDY